MKNFYLSLLLLTTISLSTYEINAQNAWSYIGNYDVIIGVYDSDHFVVDIDNRDYKYTTDGGATFQDIGITVNSPRFLVSVEYLSTTNLRAVVFNGSNYELYESNDGGANFTKLSDILPSDMFAFNQQPKMVSFDNSESLLSCKVLYNSNTIDVIFRTLDGGNSWDLATVDTFYFEDLYDIEIYKDGHVIAASNNPQGVELSSDRGQTFTTTGSFPPLNSSMEVAYDGGQNLWAGNIIGSQNAKAYYSSDGGATWNDWNVINDCDEVKYTDPSTLLVWGTDDITSISTDGGNTFSAVTFPAVTPTGSILRIRTADDQQTYYCFDGTAKLWIMNASNTADLTEWGNEKQIIGYPNPATDQVYIEDYQGEVEIYNAYGQLLKRTTIEMNGAIDISELPSGMMILQLTNGTTRVLKK
jgi:photosystem II stability/assembly factor-like uncharacterized protein